MTRDLSELLAKCRDKGKKLNNSDIERLSSELSLMFSYEGLTDSSVEALFVIPPETGMKILSAYLVMHDDASEELLSSFLEKGALHHQGNGSGAFPIRLAYLWSALYEARYKRSNLLGIVFRNMVDSSFKQSLDVNKKAVESIRKSIFLAIRRGFPLPDISTQDEASMNRTRTLLLTAAFEAPLQKHEEEIRRIVVSWLTSSSLMKTYVIGSCPAYEATVSHKIPSQAPSELKVELENPIETKVNQGNATGFEQEISSDSQSNAYKVVSDDWKHHLYSVEAYITSLSSRLSSIESEREHSCNEL